MINLEFSTLGGKRKRPKKLKFECQEIMGLFKIEDLAEEPRKYKDAGTSLFFVFLELVNS